MPRGPQHRIAPPGAHLLSSLCQDVSPLGRGATVEELLLCRDAATEISVVGFLYSHEPNFRLSYKVCWWMSSSLFERGVLLCFELFIFREWLISIPPVVRYDLVKVNWRGSTFVSREARRVKELFDHCVADPPDPVDRSLWSLVASLISGVDY